jgi:hypothetical protein
MRDEKGRDMHPRASIVRGVLSAAIAVTLVSAGAASATVKKKPKPKPKPLPTSCKLVNTASGGVTDQSLDITSADVATDATRITVVFRVAKLTAGTDTSSPLGRQWTLSFTIDGHLVSFNIYDGPFGAMASYPSSTQPVFDTTKNEIRFTTTLKQLADASATPEIRNKGSVLTAFNVFSNETVEGPNVPGAIRGGTLFGLQQADSASSSKKYIAGYPSCVKVGS